MGNTEEFIRQFKKYKDIYLENRNGKTVPEKQKELSAANVIEKMVSDYLTEIVKASGVTGYLDLFQDEMNQEDSAFSKMFMESAVSIAKDLPAGETKNEIQKILDKHKEDRTVLSAYEELKPYLNGEKTDEASGKFARKMVSFSQDWLETASRESLELMDQLIEKKLVSPEHLKDKEEYLNSLETGVTHPYASRLNELKLQAEKAPLKDESLISALTGLNEIMTDVQNPLFVKFVVEKIGKTSDGIFADEIKEYKDKNHSGYALNKINKNNPEELYEYYQKHSEKEYAPSEEFIRKTAEIIRYARENGIAEMNPSRFNEYTALSDVYREDSVNLKKAVSEGNAEGIKTSYKSITEKIRKTDYIIGELKKIDKDHHLFIGNQSSTREEYYPGKYRLDFEGTALFNQMMYVSECCLRYGVEPEEALRNPSVLCTKAMESVVYGENELTDAFRPENPFEFVKTLGRDTYQKMNMLYAGPSCIDRIATCLTINNPENKGKCGFAAEHELETRKLALNNNLESVEEGIKDNNKVYLEILPAMLALGKDFDAVNMVNGPKPQVDFATLKPKAPFSLKEAMKKYCTFESMKENLVRAFRMAKQYDDPKSPVFYQNIGYSLKVFQDNVSSVLEEKYHMKSNTASKIARCMAENRDLTPIQKRTVDAQVAFTESEKSGFLGEALDHKVHLLASLTKSYKSHNFLAQVFYKNLRDQKACITYMKKTLMDHGITRADLEDTVKRINSGKKTTDLNFKEIVLPAAEKTRISVMDNALNEGSEEFKLSDSLDASLEMENPKPAFEN